MTHFADRLAAAVQQKRTPLCVGLDPRWESLPVSIRERYPQPASAYEVFCQRVLEIVAPLVAVVKPQVAFFEQQGEAGYAVLGRLLRRAKSLGLLTILDGKRNDIASTATAYAEAAFQQWQVDACTVNPYLGRDAVEPFLSCARGCQAGVFLLVRTSNPGAGLFQDLRVEDGRFVYEHVGAAVASWARENLGACGFGDVGAVVGATYPVELQLLRDALPEVWFLVPGFGAQGGSADDVRPAFREDGLGAVVNSSRGILFPFAPEADDWEQQIEAATHQAIEAMRADRPPVRPR